MNEIIEEMERYAEANNVPILEKDSIIFMKKLINQFNLNKVLEIGTAIGYSAILMATANENVEITTIENDDKRYREAVKNVNACELDKRIDIVFNDAMDVNLAGLKYDLIFIDAAKSQYIKYFEKFKNYLNPGGMIVTDNLKFHGFVNNKDKIESKNVKGIVEHLEEYIDFLNNNDDYTTKYFDVGDGLSVTYAKNDEKYASFN
jgi:predicted O-methyltransferase YrrM